MADKDMEALAGLCAYPVYVSLGEATIGEEIADESAFLKMDAGQIFESLLKEIADTDVDTLEQLAPESSWARKTALFSTMGWTGSHYRY